MEKFGLKAHTIKAVWDILEKHPEIEKALIYGSRAKGNYREGSDIDLTLFGNGLPPRLPADLLDELDDTFLPYTFDVSNYEDLKNEALKEHIDRVGVVFYEKKRWLRGE